MKKLFSVLFIFTGLTAFLTGCTDGETVESNIPEESSSKAERISSSPIDPEIIGKWDNGSNGYIFNDDRTVSLFVDFSDSDIYFTEDGDFSRGGELIGTENVQYDGSNIVVVYDDSDPEAGMIDIYTLVDMTRRDEANPDSMDGVYTLNGCTLLQYMAELSGMDYEQVYQNEDFDFEAVIDGQSLTVTFGNFCNYETLGDSLELFSTYMNYADDNATSLKYTYKISDDTLTMTYSDSEGSIDEVYTRAK